MAKSDLREGASSRQDRNTIPPAVQPAGLYRRKDLMFNMGMTDKSWSDTLQRGIDQGKPLKPLAVVGTVHWYSARLFIEWLESLELVEV